MTNADENGFALDSVAATIAKLARKTRRVFDYLGMSANAAPRRASLAGAG
jgi:hypothetical protein